jgi:ABC-type Fe3+-siderophore transport system permease subunit
MLSLMVNAVIFGSLVVAVLSIPGLKPFDNYLVPAVIVLSLIATPYIAWKLAPHLRSRKLYAGDERTFLQ